MAECDFSSLYVLDNSTGGKVAKKDVFF